MRMYRSSRIEKARQSFVRALGYSGSAQLRESTRYSGPLDPVVIATDARGVNALRDYFQQDVATANLTEYLCSEDELSIGFLEPTNFNYAVF